MDYRVLGKLEVVRDGEPVDLGAFRQRALLGLLLTAPNTVLSTDQLIDQLWGDNSSGGDRQNSLWVYVSGLRKALEPDREKRSEGSILLTRAPGYLLQVDPDEIDAVRFEHLVAEGRALAPSDPAAASMVLGEALALWQGRAYEDFTYESFAQTEIARLEELRLEAVEGRIEADLQRGLTRELVSELETLVRQHPLREHLTGQLMLAQYRSGRQADALRAYQLLQSKLGEELGLEPSTALRRLEEQIITGDPALDPSGPVTTAQTTETGLAVRGYELREKIGEGAFGVAYRAYQPAIGREVAIKVIRPELANDPNFIRRFEAEAQLVARLEHPHIVPLYDYWREPDAAYLVMRLMKGGSLADVLERSALTPEQAAGIVDQLGSALQTAHRSSVVHRDIKPANILIDDDGNAFLSDFGIAVGTESSASDSETAYSTLTAPYASPEQLDRDRVTPSSDVYSLGVVVAQALTGMRGDIDQIGGALAQPVREVIERATASDSESRYQHVTGFVSDLSEALGGTATERAAVAVQVENPYKGLRAFGGADAADFHGRERLVDRLVARLGEPGARGRFVAVVGPSGSGKSSVVRAGLLPAIRRGAAPGSDSWFTIEMTPAPHPFEALEEALQGVAVDPPASLLEQLVSADGGLQQAIRRVLPEDSSQLLLVIDQFEELFTQVAPNVAQLFLDTLVSAVADQHSRLKVVVTLRADFYDRPLRHRGIGELLHEGTQVVTPMTAQDLERAITGPVERLGVSYEPALVAELVRDVVDRTGALPLLQYTLTELFESRRGTRITAGAYADLGGVSGALVERAEGLLAGLGDDAHDTTRQVFLRLVTLGEGADDTRRRVLQTELEQLAVDGATLQAVLDTFGRHRLLSFDRDPVTRSPTVEISHEALLTEWTRLREWIDAARHDVRNQRRLAEAMGEWAAADSTDEYLLRGGRLDQLHGWATTTSLPLSSPEQAFLDASLAERERAETEEQEREHRAVAAEQRERQRGRQLAIAGFMGVVVAALAVFGIVQWRSAEDSRAATEAAKEDADRLVLAAELVTASAAVLDDDPEEALLLATAAVRQTAPLGYASEDAVDSVHWALQRLGTQYPVGPEAAFAVRSGPTGLAGVFVMPPADLVALAEASTDRQLTDAECRAAIAGPCPQGPAIPPDTPLRFGVDNYGVVIPEVLPDAPSFEAGPLAGTRVSFAAASAVARADGLEAELEHFTELTGIDVTVVPNDDFQATTALTAGSVEAFPDVALSYGPPAAWAQPRAIDLSQFLDVELLRADFGDHLIDISTTDVEGSPELQTIPTVAVPKGLVFYAKPVFEEAGYEIPATWEELIALSTRMVADGRTPFCFHWEAGFASGFPGSDFFEAVLLRSGGVEVYDALLSGEISFASPEVIAAAELADELLFTPGFVRGGPESISSEFWGIPMGNLLDTNTFTGEPGPQCMMVIHQAQMIELLGDDTEFGPGGVLGIDVDIFPLPSVDPAGPPMTTGGGGLTAAFSDRPEVRAFVEYMTRPEWGEVWAAVIDPADPFFPANRRFDTAAYAGDRPQADIDVRLRIHEGSLAALEAGTWRYDLSDLMPPSFGAWTDELVPGTIWQGMLDWVDRVKPIDEILADIEAARPRTPN